MTVFLSKFNEEYDESVTTLESFLKSIDDGLVTEAHLTLLVGPLRDAFEERKLPDIVENFVSFLRHFRFYEGIVFIGFVWK